MKNQSAGKNRQRPLKTPKDAFGPWRPWTERQRQEPPCAGVYVLARFESAPDPTRCPSIKKLPKEIVYVGMSKNLNNRPVLAQANGTEKYREVFPDDRNYKKLYFSIWPVFRVGCPNRRPLYALLQYLEMKVQWRYAQKYHARPRLHYKRKRGARKGADQRAA